MIKSEIVIDQHYKDFSPMQFGSETCDPGHFFDVRPYRNRPTKEPYSHLVRFSYGPNRRTVATALSRMAEVIREHR